MQVELKSITKLTESLTTFSFATETPTKHTAGQFIELTLPHDDPDDRGIRRWFTLSSSPSDEFVTITTRFSGDKSSSFKKALFDLEPGATLTMSEPMGDFVLPKDQSQPLIFIAGGIGITPFLSIMRALIASQESRQIKLLWAVRSEDDIIYPEVLKDSGIHTTIIVENPSDAWGGERGKLTAELILGIEQPHPNTLIYMSGPEPLVEALTSDLKKRSIAPRQIVTDYFPGYTSF